MPLAGYSLRGFRGSAQRFPSASHRSPRSLSQMTSTAKVYCHRTSLDACLHRLLFPSCAFVASSDPHKAVRQPSARSTHRSAHSLTSLPMIYFYSAPPCASFAQRTPSSAPTEQVQHCSLVPHVPPTQGAGPGLASDLATPLWEKVVREVRLYALLISA